MLIGLDIGGTKIEGVLVNPSNPVVSVCFRVPTPKSTYADFLCAVKGVINDLIEKNHQIGNDSVKSIGIGCCGSINKVSGKMQGANILYLNGEDFLNDVQSDYELPVALTNDANCLAISEFKTGAAQNAQNSCLAVILGTGCGSGVIINGDIVDGLHGLGGEIGHNPLPNFDSSVDGPNVTCYCGSENCIESFLSGTGLERSWAEKYEPLSAQLIFKAYNSGDKKAVACIEDTAVALEDLPNFIEDFTKILDEYQQEAVYYAHAGAGEIHLRPILNLKKKEDVVLFRKITTETAKLVKQYKGSFSGEHGDGIVRAEFIPLMIGQENYQLLRRIKKAFDPNDVFNKGKITDAFPMDESLRYQIDRKEPIIKTIQDFSESEGILKLAEKCNGSGDCRKPISAGGTMCPSYKATKNEKDTTRARANTLREFLTNSDEQNKFNHKELKEVFDLCLSCKACASECPSNVDVAALKAEFLYQYQETNGYSFRSKLFANNVKYNQLGSIAPALTNMLLNTWLAKSVMGIAQQRIVPKLAPKTFSKWFQKQSVTSSVVKKSSKKIYLFNDEFTNYYDVEIGKDAVFVLEKLGYEVIILNHSESGRSFISKGFLKEAKQVCNENISVFKDVISDESPLIGIEPSAILTFRDEYLRLADDKTSAEKIAKNTFTIEEFLNSEHQKGNIDTSLFTSESKTLKIHGHCHQKALSSTSASFNILNIPENYSVTILNTGCCGMAGSFGYEKEHYEISMQVGEDTLFPKVRNCTSETAIVASGTSCRHQIFDGTKRIAQHPITLLKNALV